MIKIKYNIGDNLQMFCGMVLQNFVYFEKRFVFDFFKIKNGLNIFVGVSLMGKMVVFELIRRCMDSRFNLFFINRVNLNERVYVFCEFYFDIDKYGLIVIIGMIVDVNIDNYFSIM